MKVAIYVDYENLHKRLKDYEIHPVRDLDIFKRISNNFKEAGHNIVKFISFANFEDEDFEAIDQTKIHNFGVDVRHCSLDGKSSTDMELTVEVLRDLYKDSRIEAFVIISNDRDYIPVVKTVKSEGKITYTITTKNGLNKIVNVFSDYHQYIEDLFNIQGIIEKTELEENESLDRKAHDACSFLYKSNIWTNFIENNKPVSLKGYASNLKKTWKDSRSDIENYFHHAHKLKYVEIYEINEVKHLRQGQKYDEFIKDEKETIAV